MNNNKNNYKCPQLTFAPSKLSLNN